MKRLLSVVAIALLSLSVTAIADAQENIATYACQEVGSNSAEPLVGDETHRLKIVDYSCLVTAGPMSGGLGTGRDVYEIESDVWRLLMGGGVIRKPGATAVYVKTDKGHGHYVLAVGGAASLSDKSFTLNEKENGMGQFSIVEKLQ
jgi:hypothetical protein